MKKKKAVFLDRDGTLIHSVENRPANTVEEVRLINAVPRALGMLKSAGFLLMVVSNQGGIAAGFVTSQIVGKQHRRLNKLLEAHGCVKIDAFAYCPHPTTGNCDCRKPKPGMLRQLADKYDVDLSKSYMVGDYVTDMQAGRAAGVRACIMVSSGAVPSAKRTQGMLEADACFPNLIQCAAAIIALEEIE